MLIRAIRQRIDAAMIETITNLATRTDQCGLSCSSMTAILPAVACGREGEQFDLDGMSGMAT